MDKVITSVRLGTASRGKTHTIEFELKPENGLRRRVPTDKPSSAEIKISDDAPLGVLFDCHIEFVEEGRGGPMVFKKNDVFRIVELRRF